MSPPRAGLTPRAKVLLPAFLIVLLLASYYRIWRTRDADTVPTVFSGETMGTTFRVVLAAPLEEERYAEIDKALIAELDRINGLMSTYRDDSELSSFNEARVTTPIVLSSDTLRVIDASLTIAEESGGAFDATVRPLVAAWGFGAKAQVEPPTAAELEKLRRFVGYQKLSVDQKEGTVSKAVPELSLDLSAIAKGFAVDRLAELLSAQGFGNYMVEVGGEVRARGQRVPGEQWRIGIEQPDSETRAVRRVVPLRDLALATSGDYRNYYERDGKRVSHTIDPRTGHPITHRLASVSVVHETAMMADGYATALNVLGPEKGPELAERLNLAALFIIRAEAGDFRTHSTSRFDALMEP